MSIKKRKIKNRVTMYQKITNLAIKHREVFISWYGKTYGIRLDKYCMPCIVKDVMKDGKYKDFVRYLEMKLVNNGILKPGGNIEI